MITWISSIVLKVNPKPDPEIYIKSIKSLKLKPNNCLILEDNEQNSCCKSFWCTCFIKNIDDKFTKYRTKIKEISKK